jgi:formylglycine-generating enzyme required for sulfatase activity
MDLPVEQVTWSEAFSFARRLSGICGGAYRFALPSQRQWRAAAGEELPTDDLAWHRRNSRYSSQPVGRKRPTATGLYDLFGNVMEWCRDAYGEDAGRGDQALMRVAKGGSWHHELADCAATVQKGVLAGIRYSYLGLRLVCIRRQRRG